jgi:hypothetical protein
MNALLGQLHFRGNVIAFLLTLTFPIYFNLTLRSLAGESPQGASDRTLRVAMNSRAWGTRVWAIVQILFLANLLWTVFRGERLFRPAMIESFPGSKKA